LQRRDPARSANRTEAQVVRISRGRSSEPSSQVVSGSRFPVHAIASAAGSLAQGAWTAYRRRFTAEAESVRSLPASGPRHTTVRFRWGRGSRPRHPGTPPRCLML
jgi:hypothetical protein